MATGIKTGGRVKGTPNKATLARQALAGAADPALSFPLKTDPPPQESSLGESGPVCELAQERKLHFPAYRLVKTSALIPYANNARTHTEAQVRKIAASIREFGFTNPVLTDGRKGIVAGHGRVLAAKQLGLDEIPAIELSHLTAAQRRAYVLADNRLALDAGWDDELLAAELGDLKDEDFDLSLTGFDDKELDKLFGSENEGPSDQEPDAELNAKVCCPSCGHEFQTVAKAFRMIAGKTTYRRDTA